MNDRLKALIVTLLWLGSAASWADSPAPPIIPQPLLVETRTGAFVLHSHGSATTKILAEPACAASAQYLADRLHQFTGGEFPIEPYSSPSARDGILLTTAEPKAGLEPEGYELIVAPDKVVISGSDEAGVFYGMQSLLQLLRVSSAAEAQIPCVRVQDHPRFKWRGMMLDVSRHFFNKAEVKQVLEAMAYYKLNRFHWHLADDQGWRLQIKKYPRLTEVGAWRSGVGFGLDPKATTAYGPDGRYGGFYTPDDVREVVAYAQARHITIVPEIEMPGHASAALTAYPQYSCTGGPYNTEMAGGIFDGVYCAGNDDTFTFLQGVLSEVFELFPGPYVHVGGDEVLTTNWSHCAKCQLRRQQEGLARDIDLESYFIRRMEKFVTAHHRTLIGWSEIREGGLAESAVVMDWAGGAVEAASAGHDVVMSPLADCYFDHYQSRDHSSEPRAIGGFLPLSQVYAFDPIPAKLDPKFERHILGAQANLWTEYIPSVQHVEYMLFPRLCALAEVVWSPKSARDWQDFQRRLVAHYSRLEQMGLNYRHPTSAVGHASSNK